MKKSIENSRRFYLLLENCLDIHLGVADKSDLLRHLSQTDHTCWDDLWYDTTKYLWSIGHRSREFEELMKKIKQAEDYWARFFPDI